MASGRVGRVTHLAEIRHSGHHALAFEKGDGVALVDVGCGHVRMGTAARDGGGSSGR